MIWKQKTSVEALMQRSEASLSAHLGIEFIEIGDDHILAKMPVDHRTVQPMGKLHGGASVVLAETLGSVAGILSVEKDQYVVGLEINANHLKSVGEGYVYGKVTPIHLGRTTQVWNIEITNESGALVCISRLTVAVMHQTK
jgi:1,4-dihydroxy-2-naphthoyl-CoA hydrolase